MFEFEFDNLRLAYVNEYDGFYVISFKSRNVKQGNDLMKKYYSKSRDDKYKTNAKKEIILNPFDITDNSKVYKCEHCGKEIICLYSNQGTYSMKNNVIKFRRQNIWMPKFVNRPLASFYVTIALKNI